MRNTTHEFQLFLDEAAANARAGDRLPPVRELMRRFGLSQVAVQRVIGEMRRRGVVQSHVGRGTFFLARGRELADRRWALPRGTTSPGGDLRSRSILLLSRAFGLARGRTLIERLHQRFADAGHRVVEVSYSDPGDASDVLKGLPRFDACVIQSNYRTIPIEVLAAAHEKAEVIAVDGTALIGSDVEVVGTEWGEPLAAAAQMLYARGHRRLAFAATCQPLLALQLGFRRWEHLQRGLPDAVLQTIRVQSEPDRNYLDALVAELNARVCRDGRLPFTALIAWGVDDDARFRKMLLDRGLTVPDVLSIVILGRTDLPNEGDAFFEVVGSSVEDQVEALYESIGARWSGPAIPYALRLLPVRWRGGLSVSQPH